GQFNSGVSPYGGILVEAAILWLLSLFLKLFPLVLKQQREKNQRVIEYIDKCLEHLRVLITPESHAESEIEYSRKFLQRAYQEVPEILDNIATAKEGDIIRKSLMAGRVYYHAVRYGKVE